MTLFAPRDDATLELAVEYAGSFPTPCAFRYPRGAMMLENGSYPATPFELGKAEYLEKEGEILLIGYGNGVGRAVAVREHLKNSGIEIHYILGNHDYWLYSFCEGRNTTTTSTTLRWLKLADECWKSGFRKSST
jgi:deoxyxylulose-5-phosphate synthase